MRRGEIWWIDFGEPFGSAPGFRRPCLIVSANVINATAVNTVIVATITSQLRFANVPGCFRLPSGETGLRVVSYVNVGHLTTVDKQLVKERVGRIPDDSWKSLEDNLRTVLGISKSSP